MKKIKYTFLLLIVCSAALAQKPLILNYDDFVKAAKAELDSSMKSGELKEFAMKHPIKGEYIFDLTIHEKGKVLSVFAVSNDSDNIKSQNMLKDFLRTLSFSFKLPKGKNYKFQYTFQFP